MKRICMVCFICLLFLCACSPNANREEASTQAATEHEHVPDGADCSCAQYCSECGEMLAEQGPHDYPPQPNAEEGGYSYYVCRVCGHIKIINQDGLPVVPVG